MHRYIILFISFLFLNGCAFAPTKPKISPSPLSRTSTILTPLPHSPQLRQEAEREKPITSKPLESPKEEKTASEPKPIATPKSPEVKKLNITLASDLDEKSSRNIRTPRNDVMKTSFVIASLRPVGVYAPASSPEGLQAGGEGEAKQSQPFLDTPRIAVISKAQGKTYPEIEGPIVSEQKKQPTITYDIPITINKKVEWYLNYFTSQGRKPFKSWLARSGRYIKMIKKTFRDYKLPEDLAYLALIESGFNYKAYSRCHAVGMWQFIKGTGKRYGLKINWWVDERRDPEKATIAAAKHLLDLYQEFGCWYLAMAGYNAGAGKIRWAIEKAGTENFWQLAKKRLLKKETRNYVPKMIAATLIAKKPEKYGFNKPEYLSPMAFDTVTVEDTIGLKLIASLADTTKMEIQLLNPELKRWCTPPGIRYTLKIPAGKGNIFKKRLAQTDIKKRMAFTVHRIEKGETLSTIARLYGKSVMCIKDFNHLSSIHKIRAGRTLIIPINKKEYIFKRKTIHIDNDNGKVHIVQKGDTLWDIARKYKIGLSELRKWNNLADGNSIIRPGDSLILASASREPSTF